MKNSTFLLKMKLTIILLLVAMMQVQARGYSQMITLKQQNAQLEDVFVEIMKQTNSKFVYSPPMLKGTKPIDVDLTNVTLEEALELCFEGQPLTYIIENNTVIVKMKELPPPPVNGRITDEQGKPVPYVNIMIKGTTIGVVSNDNGEFVINVKKGDILVFSFIGYQTTEIKVVDGPVNVVLKVAANVLDEVQVIGYGTTNKRLNTGSVSTVKAEDIAKQPVTNPLLALQGRLPGVLATQSNGIAGSKVSIQIRGQNFVGSGRNEPLYIVDGVPFPSTAVNKNIGTTVLDGAYGESSPINSISPSDIESIDILKDADATAIYGSRAANGVVLITTKKGKSGKTSFNVGVTTGISNVSHMVETLDTKQYVRIRKIALANAGITTINNTTAIDLASWDTTKTYDFQKQLIGNTAQTTDATVSVSGGDLQTRFLLSGSFHKETTVFPGEQGYKRASILLNTDHTSDNKKFNIGISVQYSADANNVSLTDPTAAAYTLVPNYPLYNTDGTLYWGASVSNPLASLLMTFDNKVTSLVGHVQLRYTIIPGLDIKTSLGYSKMQNDQVRIAPGTAYNPSYNMTSNSQFLNSYTDSYIIEPQITYQKEIAQGTLNVLLGGTWQSTLYKQPYYLMASGFSSDDFLTDPAAASTRTVTTASSLYKYASMFGRINYNWRNKYIINGTFRRDGSSKFGPNNRFGNFGALGAAWIFTEESFFKNVKWLSYGKLRGSYGTSGNDQIGNFSYVSTYVTGSTYGATAGLIPTRIANPDYRWEINKKIEASLELGFINNRLLFTATWFRNRSNNQLVSYSLSPQAGFTSYQANMPALVQNTGVELALNTVNIQNNSIKWTSAFNITVPRNKLISYPDLINSSYSSSYAIGYPLSSSFLYHYTGDDATTGLPTVADMNGDGTYQSGIYLNGKGDRIYAGATYPAFYGGLNNSVSYKNFQFDVFVQFTKQQGRSIATGTYYPPGLMYNMSLDLVNDYLGNNWEKNPKITQAYAAAYTAYSRWTASDASLVDASFIRLKNINISYKLPATFLEKCHLQNIRIYLQGQNLLTLTNYKGFDPETKGVALPPLRTFMAGIQLSL